MPQSLCTKHHFHLSFTMSRFSNGYFVDATTGETIEADLRNTALAKGIGDSGEDTLNSLSGQHEEWLLLLNINNADDTTLDFRKYILRCSHSNTLITGRNRDTIEHASDGRSSFQVSKMHANDAKLFRQCTFDNCVAYMQELGHLALTVVQASAYILKSECSLDWYLETHRERRGELLEEADV